MKIIVSLVVALLSTLASLAPVHADAPSDAPSGAPAESSDPIGDPDSGKWTRTGPYVALGGGVAMGDLGREAAGLPTWGSAVMGMDTASGSVGVRAGYRFHPRVSVELLFDYQIG